MNSDQEKRESMQWWKRDFWYDFRPIAKVVAFLFIVIVGFVLDVVAMLLGNEGLMFLAEYLILAPIPLWIFILIIIELIQMAESGCYCSTCRRRRFSCLGRHPIE